MITGITAIIIDDELKNISMLRSLLHQYCPQVMLLGTATSAAAGKQLIGELKPQLVFLDIEMPYGNGFEMLESMPGLDAEIIFITAFDQYALHAFKYAALAYLLKPVNIDELEAAVKRAEQRIKEKNAAVNLEQLLKNIDESDISKQSIAFTDNGREFLIKIKDIMYIIADGSYTHVYTTGKVIVSTKNLKDFESILPESVFCRIHNGHIVNKTHITKIQKGRGGLVVMTDGQKLEIAVRRKEDFLKMFRK